MFWKNLQKKIKAEVYIGFVSVIAEILLSHPLQVYGKEQQYHVDAITKK